MQLDEIKELAAEALHSPNIVTKTKAQQQICALVPEILGMIESRDRAIMFLRALAVSKLGTPGAAELIDGEIQFILKKTDSCQSLR